MPEQFLIGRFDAFEPAHEPMGSLSPFFDEEYEHFGEENLDPYQEDFDAIEC